MSIDYPRKSSKRLAETGSNHSQVETDMVDGKNCHPLLETNVDVIINRKVVQTNR